MADDVDEFMLGFDWLTAQKAKLDFNAKTLTLHGLIHTTIPHPSASSICPSTQLTCPPTLTSAQRRLP